MKYSGTALLVIALAGCTNSSPSTTNGSPSSEPSPSRSLPVLTEQELYSSAADTVCGFSDTDTIEAKDIDNLNILVEQMHAYKGNNEKNINETADKLEGYSGTFETMVGVKQNTALRDQLVKACDSIKEEYQKRYPTDGQ